MLTLIQGPKLDSLLAQLANIATVPGMIVELGVYQGGSLAALAEAAPNRQVVGFDTFEGLPREAWTEGEPHSVGDFGDTSLGAVRNSVAHLPNISLCPGLFPASAAGIDLPIALAHVDFDFYESTRAAIEWLLPRMAPGGVIVFDDYGWKHCPGVMQAIEEAELVIEVHPYDFQAIYRHEG